MLEALAETLAFVLVNSLKPVKIHIFNYNKFIIFNLPFTQTYNTSNMKLVKLL